MFWFGNFHFCFSSKLFFDIEGDQKKSLLGRFLQQKYFIEVRLVYGFRQDCRKMKDLLLFFDQREDFKKLPTKTILKSTFWIKKLFVKGFSEFFNRRVFWPLGFLRSM